MMTLARWKVILVLLATILGLLFTLPNLLPADVTAKLPPFMPKNTLKLGLDLQGGSDLLYSVDTVALRNERLTNMAEDIRNDLHNKQFEFSDLAVTPAGDIMLRVTDPGQVNAVVN